MTLLCFAVWTMQCHWFGGGWTEEMVYMWTQQNSAMVWWYVTSRL